MILFGNRRIWTESLSDCKAFSKTAKKNKVVFSVPSRCGPLLQEILDLNVEAPIKLF